MLPQQMFDTLKQVRKPPADTGAPLWLALRKLPVSHLFVSAGRFHRLGLLNWRGLRRLAAGHRYHSRRFDWHRCRYRGRIGWYGRAG